MKFVGVGEKGFLGYCKVFVNNVIVSEFFLKIDFVKKVVSFLSVFEKKIILFFL